MPSGARPPAEDAQKELGEAKSELVGKSPLLRSSTLPRPLRINFAYFTWLAEKSNA